MATVYTDRKFQVDDAEAEKTRSDYFNVAWRLTQEAVNHSEKFNESLITICWATTERKRQTALCLYLCIELILVSACQPATNWLKNFFMTDVCSYERCTTGPHEQSTDES